MSWYVMVLLSLLGNLLFTEFPVSLKNLNRAGFSIMGVFPEKLPYGSLFFQTLYLLHRIAQLLEHLIRVLA